MNAKREPRRNSLSQRTNDAKHLALALFVPRIRRADHVHAALTAHHLAVLTDTFNACPDFHFRSLQQPIRPPTTIAATRRADFVDQCRDAPRPRKNGSRILLTSWRRSQVIGILFSGRVKMGTPGVPSKTLRHPRSPSSAAFTNLFRIPHTNTRQTATLTSTLSDRADAAQ